MTTANVGGAVAGAIAGKGSGTRKSLIGADSACLMRFGKRAGDIELETSPSAASGIAASQQVGIAFVGDRAPIGAEAKAKSGCAGCAAHARVGTAVRVGDDRCGADHLLELRSSRAHRTVELIGAQAGQVVVFEGVEADLKARASERRDAVTAECLVASVSVQRRSKRISGRAASGGRH